MLLLMPPSSLPPIGLPLLSPESGTTIRRTEGRESVLRG
jgi:hypothetical protein